jgi:hypothetical protein
MKYTIYKITNLINNKEYIGKHQTENENDDYLGSGKSLRHAIEKHGRDNFKKEVLFVFDNEEEMNRKEAELVSEEYCSRKDTYNLCPGGHGGWGYINSNGMNVKDYSLGIKQKERMTKDKEYASKVQKILNDNRHKTIEALLSWQKNNPSGSLGMLGKKHKDETKSLMKIKASGKNSSQYGTCWITNGIENKKIKKEELDKWTSLGYNKGRISLS